MADKPSKRETAGRRKRPGQRGRSVPPGAEGDSDRAAAPAAPERRKQADPRRGPGDSTESSGGANECEKSVETESPQTIRGRNGGTLTPFQSGVSGNPHRGPDRFPGRNAVRSVFLIALAADGLSLPDLRRKRKHRKGHSLIPFAMSEHCKQGYKNIAIDAALGKPEAYAPFLRMMRDAHAMLQPAKDEVARAHDRRPFPATFIHAPQSAAPREAGPAPPPSSAPGSLFDANGQEYVG